MLKYIHAAIHWILSVAAIPFGAFYKAIRTGIIHIFDEVDRLFNIAKKDITMATLEDIATAIAGLPAAIVAALPAAAPVTVDTTAIEAAITAGTAAVIAEIKSNVEGAAPAPAAQA